MIKLNKWSWEENESNGTKRLRCGCCNWENSDLCLESDWGQGSAHAFEERRRAFGFNHVTEESESRGIVGRLLKTDPDGVERVTGNDTRHTPKSSSCYEFSAPAACKKFWPKLHISPLPFHNTNSLFSAKFLSHFHCLQNSPLHWKVETKFPKLKAFKKEFKFFYLKHNFAPVVSASLSPVSRILKVKYKYLFFSISMHLSLSNLTNKRNPEKKFWYKVKKNKRDV